ncbi:MAG: 2Fe-2S iron-sulfur cluster binding domain-containing protein, partial [Anaerolineales bacterium]|nr:2Fe-2S iron-sulfur cluster binding domain-containing protein [Anaerolineales bacterium]
MQFTLNGEVRHYDGDPELPLLSYLRDVEGIISPKDGCAPQAACGCCLVHVDGKGVLACVTAMKRLDGAEIVTVEGLGDYRQSVYANAFVSCGGVQCGFCIPGMVMQADALINQNPAPTRDEIAHVMRQNLCRCTGYKKIIDAIEMAAEAIRLEEELPPPAGDGRIGSRQPKYHARDLVLGQHRYVDDIRIDGLWHGALRFSDHPRALVKAIDIDGAMGMPGVKAVLTAKDFPGDRYIGLIAQDWPQMIDIGETTRYIGDVMALVVAESEAEARAAAAAIMVAYEVL